MKKEAKFWTNLSNDRIQCLLCPHNCKIDNGKRGICNARINEDGKLYTLIYGSCSSLAVDPIEKKPLYHFYPGSSAFSLGTVGCNFKCLHCQNYTISTADIFDFPYIREITPEQSVELARHYGCEGISYTYNEPTIWYEFTLDSAKLAKEAGLYTCYVTNGYICEEPLREISKVLDAMNIDVKAFTEDFYRRVCKARLQPVLDTCVLAKELGIHIELTYLVIPGYNDSLEEVKKFCKWVLDNLGRNIAVHFSRFHPDHKMLDVPVTPMETLLKIYKTARDIGINYTYLGNVVHGSYEDTFCPNCGSTCINRIGYSINLKGFKDGKCAKCGYILPIIY